MPLFDPRRHTLATLLVCFFLSGAAGLIDQVVWSKALDPTAARQAAQFGLRIFPDNLELRALSLAEPKIGLFELAEVSGLCREFSSGKRNNKCRRQKRRGPPKRPSSGAEQTNQGRD
jgi:hypothetical protein